MDSQSNIYISTPKSPARSNGAIMRKGVEEMEEEGASLARAEVLKTSWKLRSLLLKQLDSLTSGTSEGSAKVMSTHCAFESVLLLPCFCIGV